MLLPRTINLCLRFNVSFASLSSFQLWLFSSVDQSSAVGVTGRSKLKEKYQFVKLCWLASAPRLP